MADSRFMLCMPLKKTLHLPFTPLINLFDRDIEEETGMLDKEAKAAACYPRPRDLITLARKKLA
jgi:hypothetical protein